MAASEALIADQAHQIARQATAIALQGKWERPPGAVGDDPRLSTAKLMLHNVKTLVAWLEGQAAEVAAEHTLDKVAQRTTTRPTSSQTSYWFVCSCGKKGTRFVNVTAVHRDHEHHVKKEHG